MGADGFLRCCLGVLIICLLSMLLLLLLFHSSCGLRDGFESCWLRCRTEEGDEFSEALSFESVLSSGMESFLEFGAVGIIVEVRCAAPGVVIGNDELHKFESIDRISHQEDWISQVFSSLSFRSCRLSVPRLWRLLSMSIFAMIALLVV